MSRPRSRRLPAVGVILLGTAVGQGTVIAVSPLLTRIYGPSDFGALAVITALCSIIGAFGTMGTDRAVIVAPSRRAVRHLAGFGMIASAVVAGLVGLLAWATNDALAQAFDAPVLSTVWWLFPFTSFAISGYRLVSACLARDQRYGSIARRNAVQGLAQSVWNVSAGLLGPVGLLGGLLLGRLAGLFGSFGRSRGNDTRTAPCTETTAGPWETLRRHRRFLVVTPWSALLNVIGQQAPSILLALSLGSTTAGYVALTMRVLGSPVGMLADAVAQWSAGAFGRRIRSGDPVDQLLRRIVVRLTIAAVCGVVLILVVAPALFTAVFGERWAVSGQLARILVPAFAVQLVASPMTQLLALLGRQVTQLIWDAGRLVVTSGAVLVTGLYGASTTTTVFALSAAMVLAYGSVLVLVRRAVRANQQVLATAALRPEALAESTTG